MIKKFPVFMLLLLALFVIGGYVAYRSVTARRAIEKHLEKGSKFDIIDATKYRRIGKHEG